MEHCDYSDVYIHVKGILRIPNTAAGLAAADNAKKKVIFKNRGLFTKCVSKINNILVDDAHDIDVAMPMYSLIVCSAIYLKTESLWQYYRDEPALDNNNNIIDFPANSNIILFKFKEIKNNRETGNDNAKDFEIMVLLKNLSNFWRTLEMPLINYEIDLQLTWSGKSFLIAGTISNQEPKFTISDTKFYVTVVTLSSCKLIATDFSQQQVLDANLKVIQQVEFTGNPELDGKIQMFFIIEEAKENLLDFSKGIVKIL